MKEDVSASLIASYVYRRDEQSRTETRSDLLFSNFVFLWLHISIRSLTSSCPSGVLLPTCEAILDTLSCPRRFPA